MSSGCMGGANVFFCVLDRCRELADCTLFTGSECGRTQTLKKKRSLPGSRLGGGGGVEAKWRAFDESCLSRLLGAFDSGNSKDGAGGRTWAAATTAPLRSASDGSAPVIVSPKRLHRRLLLFFCSITFPVWLPSRCCSARHLTRQLLDAATLRLLMTLLSLWDGLRISTSGDQRTLTGIESGLGNVHGNVLESASPKAEQRRQRHDVPEILPNISHTTPPHPRSVTTPVPHLQKPRQSV